MRIGSHSEQAAAVARHRGKYAFSGCLPDTAHDRWKLRQIGLGQSAYFNRSEYDKGELSHIVTTVSSYNRRYRVQLKVFKHQSYYEVARIS